MSDTNSLWYGNRPNPLSAFGPDVPVVPSNPLAAVTISDPSGTASLADAWTLNAQRAQAWLEQQRAQAVSQGLWNPDTGLPTSAGLVDAARQYAGGVMMGTTAPGGGLVRVANPIRAYHGSPYDFDAFDMSKIGTGEGAQAYGHGIYFAGNEGVARSYRDALSGGSRIPGAPSGKSAYAIGGEYPPENMAGHTAMDTAIDLDGLMTYMHMYENKPSMSTFWKPGDPIHPQYDARGAYQQSMDYLRGQIENRIQRFRDQLGPDGPRGIADQDMAAMADYYDRRVRGAVPSDVTQRGPGRMYEVNLHADPATLLDWDKSLGQQPMGGRVEDLLKSTGKPLYPSDVQSGSAAYTMLGERDLTRPRQGESIAPYASTALHQAGIPGIQYLDAGSRGAGEGTRNYVMFDPRRIEMLRKYAIPAAMLSGTGHGLVTSSPDDQEP